MIKGRSKFVKNTANILKAFNLVFGLKIIWDKFATYWHNPVYDKPMWLDNHQRRWANDEELSKLLHIAFGPSLDTQDGDEFLLSKIRQKIT